jgi:phenylalanyl-tRNA synthetase beta chain
LARFPSVSRDVSLLVSRNATFAELRQTVLDAQVDLCRGTELVDVYEGANLPSDKRSITLRLQYTADDRTLTDEEVDEMHQKIVATLEEKFDAQLRV